MRPIAITATVELGAPPEDVWRFISDTDRTNRVIGAAPVTYTPIDDQGPMSARYVATTSAGAFDLTYEELPFEWSFARELRVVRKMRGGFLESYGLTWSLAPRRRRRTVRRDPDDGEARARPAVPPSSGPSCG